MAAEADWSPDALVDPENAAERHKLNLTHREIDEIETYLISLGLLDSDHATLSGIGLTRRGMDVAHGEAEEAFAGEHISRLQRTASRQPSPTYNLQFTNATVAALSVGDGSTAAGNMSVGGHPQELSNPHIPLFVGVPPPPQRPLIGRDAELAALRAKVCASDAVALNGLPGVGKTALATALVYHPEVRAHFRGGVLWTGLGPKPDVEGALGRWASALGVEMGPEPDASARAQRFAALLQRHARGAPVLLVVDDAWSWEDARLFREVAFPGCAQVVTTRDASIARKFAGEETWVGELAEDWAEEFLAKCCPKAMTADPEGVRALSRDVGGLPLALTLIAASLNDHAGQTQWVRKEIARLTAAGARLTLEATDRRPGIAGVTNTLRAIVEMSTDALGRELQQAFETLGAFAPKPADFTQEAAAAVWEASETVSDECLRRLVERGLLEVAGEGRFALHQVLAAVANARLGEGRGPRSRHAHYHQKLVEGEPGNWRRIEQELEQIRQGWRWSVASGFDPQIIMFAYTIDTFFQRRGLWRERLLWIHRALDAARSLKLRSFEAVFLTNLGRAQFDMADKRGAQQCYEQALPLYRQLGHRTGEAAVLLNLSSVHLTTGAVGPAQECGERAMAIYREMEDRRGEAQALNNLGSLFYNSQKMDLARQYYEQVLPVTRAVGDRVGEAGALSNLGIIHAAMGDTKEAVGHYERALSIESDVGNRFGEATALNNLGVACLDMGDAHRARRCHEQSLLICREIGKRDGEATALTNLGRVWSALQDRVGARECYEQALAIYQELDDRGCQVTTLLKLGSACLSLGEKKGALDYYEQSLSICRTLGNRGDEARALNKIAEVYMAAGNWKCVHAYYEQALPIDRELGNRADEARELNNLGYAFSMMGDRPNARRCYEQALPIHRELGNRAGEAMTLFNLAELLASEGSRAGAIALLEQVVMIEEAIRHPEVEAVRSYLESLRSQRQ
jgi:tetratricopeptide (TPR) repeat protein